MPALELFTHSEVERFTQERHDRAQVFCGPHRAHRLYTADSSLLCPT
jgi:hypothetical protein